MNVQQNMRTFYTLIATQVFSLIGSRMTDLALSIYIFNQTGDVTPLALVALFSFLPQIVGAGFAGVLADRWDRRYVMMISDAGQAVGTLILLISFASGGFQIWHLYVIAFIKALFGVFQSPAFQASVTMLVPDDKRERANALMQLTGPMAGVVAPALTGGLYALIGISGIIAFDLFTFVAAVMAFAIVHIPRPAQTAVGRQMQGSIWKEMLGGIQYLWDWRSLFLLMLQISLVNFMFAASMTLYTPYLLARTGSEATMGLLMAITNVAMIGGGVVISVWGGTRPRIHTIMVGVLIGGVALVLLGTARTPLTLGIALILMMLPMPMINAVAMSLMQTKVPPDIQGRVFAVLSQMSMLLMPLAYLLVGPLVDTVFEPAVGAGGWERVAPLVGAESGAGMGLIMLIAGAIIVMTTALTYALPRVRRIESERADYVPEAVSPVHKTITTEVAPAALTQ